ncbi:MAG: hypothetical protein M3N34_08570 [Pseudomonadota bacterium]|nr:hypothetical protein [Pseudomonadota bacterium]
MTSDPASAAYAWARYRRIMRWLMAVVVALMMVALRLAGQHATNHSIRRYVVAALCVGVTMLLGATVMGLSFVLGRKGAGESPPPARPRSDAPG